MAGEEGISIILVGLFWVLLKLEEKHRTLNTEQDSDIADIYAIFLRVLTVSSFFIAAAFNTSLQPILAALGLSYGILTFFIVVWMIIKLADKWF